MRWFLLPVTVIALLVVGLASFGTAAEPKAEEDRIVYISRAGKEYHGQFCRYLAPPKVPIQLSSAKAKGYTACATCDGGQPKPGQK